MSLCPRGLPDHLRVSARDGTGGGPRAEAGMGEKGAATLCLQPCAVSFVGVEMRCRMFDAVRFARSLFAIPSFPTALSRDLVAP